MTSIGIIQARTGSTRLPGKMLYPLAGEPVVAHIIKRASCAKQLDKVVVATSTEESDGVIADVAERNETAVYRGDESDVLQRLFEAASEYSADSIVRICGDDPLLSPNCIDAVLEKLLRSGADYVSNNLDRTFPKGLDAEAFSMESFRRVHANADTAAAREHATLWYKEHPDEFSLSNVTVRDVFPDEESVHDDNLRLTLDRVPDYRLLYRVYNELARTADGVVDVVEATEFIKKNDLHTVNEHVQQKDPTNDNG
jgi:spore coat polysaccharide biosynthesis protein SpsF